MLILEDEAPLREVLTAVLQLKGWNCVSAKDGAGAMRAVDDSPIPMNAALLDLNAGCTSGFSVAARLRATHPALPVVMMTGHADEGMRSRISRLQNFVLIEKPLSMDSFEEALAQAACA